MKWKTKDRIQKVVFISFIIGWFFTVAYFYSNCQDTPVINF